MYRNSTVVPLLDGWVTLPFVSLILFLFAEVRRNRHSTAQRLEWLCLMQEWPGWVIAAATLHAALRFHPIDEFTSTPFRIKAFILRMPLSPSHNRRRDGAATMRYLNVGLQMALPTSGCSSFNVDPSTTQERSK